MVGLFCFTSIFPEKPYTESQVPDCELSFQRFFKNTPTNRSPFLLILKGCDNVTVEEKNSIIRLRKVGQGYSTIAATLGLSKETVKSFCRRNDLGGRRAQSADFQRGIGSAQLSVGNRGGMLIPNVSAEKLFIIMSVQSAVAALPLTEIATGNTVVTPVMFRLGSREVCPVTREQFNNEIMYQASIAPFRKMVNKGIISVEEYTKICTILSQKYQPIFVGNIVSI